MDKDIATIIWESQPAMDMPTRILADQQKMRVNQATSALTQQFEEKLVGELEALNQKTVRLQKREWRKDETPGYVVPVETIDGRINQLRSK